jgi:NTP pyrophosphatase (non-canonical NTP hydrolase)
VNFTEYQRAAARTANRGSDELANYTMGLAGEAGEVTNLIKKQLYHGKPTDFDAVIDELGDVLWYVAMLAEVIGADLNDVAVRNCAKLYKRWPEGFKVSE